MSALCAHALRKERLFMVVIVVVDNFYIFLISIVYPILYLYYIYLIIHSFCGIGLRSCALRLFFLRLVRLKTKGRILEAVVSVLTLARKNGAGVT